MKKNINSTSRTDLDEELVRKRADSPVVHELNMKNYRHLTDLVTRIERSEQYVLDSYACFTK